MFTFRGIGLCRRRRHVWKCEKLVPPVRGGGMRIKMNATIVYEDRDVLVIQKPAGLATQTARVGRQDVVSELKNYLAAGGLDQRSAGEPYLGIVHRLDQPVEGLLVFAKNKKAAASLTAQLDPEKESGAAALNKSYYGVFCGNTPDKSGELVDGLYRDSSGKAVIWEQSQGKEPFQVRKAVLRYRILQEEKVQNFILSLAEIHIDTGRYHQIRAQMAHAGMCLLGDSKYGDAVSREISEKLDIRNVALCAFSLEFRHPVTKEKMSFKIKPQGVAFSFFSLK